MKHIYVAALCSIGFAIAHNPIIIQTRTSNIYYRYYLIKRLEESCNLLQSVAMQQIIPYDRLNYDTFKTEHVAFVAQEIALKKTIQPFSDLWEDFCNFKAVFNEDFQQDFIDLVYQLYNLVRPICMHRSSKTSEQILYAIDCAAKSIRYNERSVHKQSEFNEVTTDLIAKRFYILKRLQKSISFLNLMHERNIKIDTGQSHKQVPFDLEREIDAFRHDRVRESVEQMLQKKNLEPLLTLCNEVKQYRFAQDEGFLQEMLMNIFLAYKTILFKPGSHTADPEIIHEMNHILEIYEHLSTMPLDETLEAIDMVTDKLMAIQAGEYARKPYTFAAIGCFLIACVCSGVYYYIQQG